MAQLLFPADWAKYKQAINDASDTFNKDQVIWHRFLRRIDRNGEDQTSQFTSIILNALIAYNFYKSWPDENIRVSGENDDTSLTLILNKQYLHDQGYLNAYGYFSMDPGQDFFTVRGIDYTTKGDTDVAQAEADPLLLYIKLDRKQINVGQNYHG